MAITKAKRSLLTNATRRNNRRVSIRHSDRGGSSTERRTQIRSTSEKTARRNNRRASNRHPEKGKPDERRNQNHGSSVWPRKILRFPQTKDKIIEDVEFYSELGYHSISVNFKDKTSLNFAIDSSFTVETDYSNWKTGNQRVLHRWRPVQNVEFRDTVRKRKQ